MDPFLLAAVLAAFLLAAFCKGVTGLGFSTMCLPMLAFLLEPRLAIPLVLLPSLATNALVMFQTRRWFNWALRRFWLLIVAGLPGIALGVHLLGSVPAGASRIVLGTVLGVYSLWALSTPPATLNARLARLLAAPCGFVNGVVNGLTGSQVMPLMPYLLALKLDKDQMVQAINLCFTVASLAMLLLLGSAGMLDRQLGLLSLAGVIPVALGIHLGGRIRDRLPQESFRKLALYVMLAIAAGLVARGLA